MVLNFQILVRLCARDAYGAPVAFPPDVIYFFIYRQNECDSEGRGFFGVDDSTPLVIEKWDRNLRHYEGKAFYRRWYNIHSDNLGPVTTQLRFWDNSKNDYDSEQKDIILCIPEASVSVDGLSVWASVVDQCHLD